MVGDRTDTLRRELGSFDQFVLHHAERAGSNEAIELALALASDHGLAGAKGSRELADHREVEALEHARAIFKLTPFERAVMLAALVVELDDRYGRLFAHLQGDLSLRRPTIGLVTRWFAYLMDDDIARASSCLSGAGHLFALGLVDAIGSGPRPGRELQIPEGFWPRLVGTGTPAPFAVKPPRPGALAELVLAASTARGANAALGWAARRPPHDWLLVVDGAEGSGREALAIALAAELGWAAIVVSAAVETVEQRRTLIREATWARAAVVLRGSIAADTLATLCSELAQPVIVIGECAILRAPDAVGPRRALVVEVAPAEPPQREQLWARALAEHAHAPDVDAATFAARFRFGPGRIRAVVTAAADAAESAGEPAIRACDVVAACRATQAAMTLAKRLDCPYEPDDLVVSFETRRELGIVLAWARHGAHAFRADGAGARLKGREGLACLFSGPPGTGKTMAAQVLARALGLDLLRVDLSQVVNKYIGETEKNLDRVFSEVVATGSILFFDEADALFGRRTQVTDAHDRYANLETAYLLQRLESHPGIVVLATNLRANLDSAFVRRIAVIADFPMPRAIERRAIWERHLAADHLAGDVDLDELATRFELSGGEIHNAVMSAVLLAAAEKASVAMRHLMIGVWRELHKGGRVVSPRDFGAWRGEVIRYAGAPRVATRT